VYQRYYGLVNRRSNWTPNPKFLFLTPRHREALSNVRYAISARNSLAVMIGEAGTGQDDAGCARRSHRTRGAPSSGCT